MSGLDVLQQTSFFDIHSVVTFQFRDKSNALWFQTMRHVKAMSHDENTAHNIGRTRKGDVTRAEF